MLKFVRASSASFHRVLRDTVYMHACEPRARKQATIDRCLSFPGTIDQRASLRYDDLVRATAMTAGSY